MQKLSQKWSKIACFYRYKFVYICILSLFLVENDLFLCVNFRIYMHFCVRMGQKSPVFIDINSYIYAFWACFYRYKFVYICILSLFLCVNFRIYMHFCVRMGPKSHIFIVSFSYIYAFSAIIGPKKRAKSPILTCYFRIYMQFLVKYAQKQRKNDQINVYFSYIYADLAWKWPQNVLFIVINLCIYEQKWSKSAQF